MCPEGVYTYSLLNVTNFVETRLFSPENLYKRGNKEMETNRALHNIMP